MPSPSEMDGISCTYNDLDLAIDEVRVRMERWSDATPTDAVDTPNPQTIRYAQLVLHEWFANLAQHADFYSTPPRIRVRASSEGPTVHCVVEDNSTGFDLMERLQKQINESDPLPERGMGLRIIDACTGEYAYVQTPEGLFRFTFSIPPDHEPWLTTLF